MLPDWITGWLGALQGWLFEILVLPLLQHAGLMVHVDDAFDGTESVLMGVVEVAVVVAVLAPLQWLIPAESGPSAASRGDRRADVVYTLIHRLGLVPLVLFFTLRPLVDGLQGWLRMRGFATLDLEHWLPGLADHPALAFLTYLVVIDLVQYWIHRGQHRFDWWWSLHALHHSQRRMTFWTDNRNHLLDDLITESILAAVALAIGVAPAQYAAIAIGTRMLESLSHANVRLWFGPAGERLLVSPRFHRRHHAIDAVDGGGARGVNFAVLLPMWDLLFGTADFRPATGPTGVADQLAGRSYGEGFWSQQWLGLVRLSRALGWHPRAAPQVRQRHVPGGHAERPARVHRPDAHAAAPAPGDRQQSAGTEQ